MTRSAFACAFAISTVLAASSVARAQTLERFASLPPDTFAPGPTSGQLIPPPPANGRDTPFVDMQPIQGFSSVLRGHGGDYLGDARQRVRREDNSPDYVLRLYRIDPDFKTRTGGSGTIDVRSWITLRDPDRKIPFAIVADGEFYPGSTIPVDQSIQRRRWLTGGDFDIESVRQAHDGTLWFGDEFGPFLIHTDATGKVLDAPYSLANVMSPQNPYLGTGAFNLPRSKGFEGMAISPNGKTLYPMLEGALTTDPDPRRLIISEFDIRSRALHEASVVLPPRGSGICHRRSHHARQGPVSRDRARQQPGRRRRLQEDLPGGFFAGRQQRLPPEV